MPRRPSRELSQIGHARRIHRGIAGEFSLTPLQRFTQRGLALACGPQGGFVFADHRLQSIDPGGCRGGRGALSGETFSQ